MVTRAQLRTGPRYSTTYSMGDHQVQDQRFHLKEENDRFAEAIEYTGARAIVKSFYNPAMCSWHRYTNEGPEPEVSHEPLP